MISTFVDTSFYLALLVPGDQRHEDAVALSNGFRGKRLTSEFVLCELGALLSAPRNRLLFNELVKLIDSSPSTDVIPATQDHFRVGLELFSKRPDKAWSLIDCISFELMRSNGIAAALAFDHHFEQAGFKLLESNDLQSFGE